MTQSRLHHLLILHCHKDRTDSLSLTEYLQELLTVGKEELMYLENLSSWIVHV